MAHLQPRQRVEPGAEAYGQGCRAQGPVQQAQEIQMAQQGRIPFLGEAQPEPLDPVAHGLDLG